MARIETLMTPDLLEQSFRKHLVWKVWARLSIDSLLFDFDLCAMCKNHTVGITGIGKPVLPWCRCEKCLCSYRMTGDQIETLHDYLWCHDAGFKLLDKGIETIAAVMGLFVDPSIEDWIGGNSDFVSAWSKEQEVYLHKSFGLTEIILS